MRAVGEQLRSCGPTLPSLEAPGAGCICADAIAVAPNNEATTRAEIASLDRMGILLLWVSDAGVQTCSADLGSSRFRPRPVPPGTPRLWIALSGMRKCKASKPVRRENAVKTKV